MDRIAAMTMFTRIVETGSLSGAASSLALSRATVSVTLRQLEEHLGVRLLHRTTRRMTLTPEGVVYYARAGELLAALDACDQLFQGARGGRLSIDVPTRIARRMIIPALPDLFARHPGLEVTIGGSDRPIDLLEKGVDAVIRVGPLGASSHIARPLGVLRQINCAAPDYLARYGRPMSVADLEHHRVVGYGASFAKRESWDYVVDGVSRQRLVPTSVMVDNAESYIAAALAGLGIIQIPAYDVSHHIESGALVEVLADLRPPSLPVTLLYPSRRQVPARLRQFSEWVATLFQKHGMFDC